MHFLKLDSLFLLLFLFMVQSAYAQSSLSVRNLAPIPDVDGFAGSLGGTSNGVLMVAGGSNFPEGGRPWNGGTKTWYNHIYVLEKPSGKWIKAGNLPRPLGYAVSVTWRDAVACVGGSNEAGHYADSFLMRWQHKKVTFEPLPDFPVPVANACGALVGDILYVAGGLETPTAIGALHTFYALDLAAEPTKRTWQLLPAWAGEGRMLSVAASAKGMFYLFSGTALAVSPDEKTVRRLYLRDAHQYDPSTRQWTRLADLPHATVAAPGPAFSYNEQIILPGGDDGKNAAVGLSLQDKHPGFSTGVLGYDPLTNTWSNQSPLVGKTQPEEGTSWPVTTPLVPWRGGYVIPGGEARPGIRTPLVWMIEEGKYNDRPRN